MLSKQTTDQIRKEAKEYAIFSKDLRLAYKAGAESYAVKTEAFERVLIYIANYEIDRLTNNKWELTQIKASAQAVLEKYQRGIANNQNPPTQC